MTSRASVGNNTVQINGLCVFLHIYLCPIFLLIGFLNLFLTNLTKVSFVNRNNLAHCNIHSDAYRCSSPKSDLPKHTYIYKSYAYSKQFRGMVKKNSKSKNALIPSYVWVFWTERCHKGELFSHKKTNFFSPKNEKHFSRNVDSISY